MGVMFQEQAAELQRELAKTVRRAEAAEKNADRLGGLLRDEKARGGAQGKEIDGLRAQIVGLERQAAGARETAGRLAEAERRADAAEKSLLSVEADLAKTAARLEQTEHAHAQARADYLGTKVERDRLRAEINPFRSLISALKARAEADALILVELGRLDG